MNEVNKEGDPIETNQVLIQLNKLEKKICLAKDSFCNLKVRLNYVSNNRPSEKSERKVNSSVPILGYLEQLQDTIDDHLSDIQQVLDNIVL
jgi:hypothetical protein